MNAKAIFAIAALAAVASTAARADDITIDNSQFTSMRTRAEVQAEAATVPTTRSIEPAGSRVPAQVKSTKTRAQVQAEYIADREEVAAMLAEDSGSARLTQVAAVRQVGATLAGSPVNTAR